MLQKKNGSSLFHAEMEQGKNEYLNAFFPQK